MTQAATMTAARWWTRDVQAGDYAVVAALFAETFGHPLHESLWHWKYAPGRGRALFTVSAAGPVAHYGGLSREVLYFGRREWACQPVDVLVRPQERGVLTRRGPMFLAADALLEAEMGTGKRHLLGLGFPTVRHLALGARLGLFVPGGRLVELHWATREAVKKDWRMVCRDMRAWPAARFDRFADQAWADMAADMGDHILGVRDAAWLRYRYLSHPLHRYEVIAVRRRWSQCCGVIVVRRHEDACELLDLVGARAAWPMLIDAARWYAHRQGVAALSGWFAEACGPMLETAGSRKTVLDVSNVAFLRTGVPPPEQVRDRWWLSAGDTDFR